MRRERRMSRFDVMGGTGDWDKLNFESANRVN